MTSYKELTINNWLQQIDHKFPKTLVQTRLHLKIFMQISRRSQTELSYEN